jgi:hypothetical protein
MREADADPTFNRVACPACFRRGRDVSVGFAVEGLGFYPLVRLPRIEERPEPDDPLLVSVSAGGESIEVGVHPPIWRSASGRMPMMLVRTADRFVRCRYGHTMRIPPIEGLDRILWREGDPIYLPAATRV